jgi:2C-methyl-D-erythritol 2,4-cyclodiphosphate synthase
VAEKPKVSSFIEEMRENISNIMMVEHDRINIKATIQKLLALPKRRRYCCV